MCVTLTQICFAVNSEFGMITQKCGCGGDRVGLSREQVRAARAVLGWRASDLAEKIGVATNTISRFENGAGAFAETLDKIEAAFQSAGIEFIGRNCIRWKEKPPEDLPGTSG